MRKKIYLLIIVSMIIVLFFVFAQSEGLLPSIDEVFDVEMPSMADILKRDPDQSSQLEDGTVELLFNNVSESAYQQYSVVLKEAECTLIDYTVEKGIIKLTIEKKGKQFYFDYDTNSETAIFRYPHGTLDAASRTYPLGRKLYIGFSAMDISDEDVKNGWPSAGILVIDVDDNSPASHANLQPGDLIVSVNEKTINNFDEYYENMIKLQKDKSVKFNLFRSDNFTVNEEGYSCSYSKQLVSVVVQPEYYNNEEE